MRLRHARNIPPRLLHGVAAVALIAATVVVVTQAMVKVTASELFGANIVAPPWRCHLTSRSVPHRHVLVLYDGTGRYSAYAAQSAVLAANLASHFAKPVRQPVASYRPGEMQDFAAVIYVGTNFGEALPSSFLSDVRSGLRPVLWLGGNAYQLTNAAYAQAHGWQALPTDRTARFNSVSYRGMRLPMNSNDLGTIDVLDRSKATVLASAVTATGRRVPWAVRSQNVIYVAEAAVGPDGGQDHSYVVPDLMASLFGPVRHRHRVLLRLEDVGPATSPEQLRQIADYLSAKKIPFSVALYPLYLGPAGQHPRKRIPLKDAPQVVEALKYMLTKGGTLVLHGYTHQLGDTRNPNNAESGEDYEFLRVRYNASHVLIYHNPAPGNTSAWARHRMVRALAAIRAAGLPRPAIWQFPEYGATPAEYRAAASMFVARFERGNYAEKVHGRYELQTLTELAPPYLVRDVYGGPVLPETLGYVVGPHVPTSGPGSVQAILAAAAVQKAAVRDNVAGVYYHPFLGVGPLRQVVTGLLQEGYHFVSDCAVLEG